MIKTQQDLIHDYNLENREKFNPVFFERSDDDIAEELMKVILSCQRSKGFTIKVVRFDIIDDYEQINAILYQNEQNIIRNKNRDNSYGFINMKDSDVKLLHVKYYIAIKDEAEYVDVYIAYPRIVDKFYYRIKGNTYNAIWQIVDNATYNNSTSTNSKKHSVIFKTVLMKVIVYRDYDRLTLVDGNQLEATYYKTRIFTKTIYVCKYIFSKFGLYGGLNFLHMAFINIVDEPTEYDDRYTFMTRTNVPIYITVPKYLYDNDEVVQSVVYTLCKCVYNDTLLEDMFTTEHWLKSLGKEFSNNDTISKGISILDSLESIYDYKTHAVIHLPEEHKANTYTILRWCMGEFAKLKTKDNLDISTKRIRIPEYIASLYAMKLSTGTYRVSDLGKRADINSIKKAICTAPEYLLKAISKCDLVIYRNLVNDLDSTTALKCTYKGIAGIGDKSNSVPVSYRSVHISHAGRVDLDSSSASDPGMSGTLCPLADLYKDNSFSDFREPDSWEDDIKVIFNNYREAQGLKQVIDLKDAVGIATVEEKEQAEVVQEEITSLQNLIRPIIKVENEEDLDGIPLEASGTICYN